MVRISGKEKRGWKFQGWNFLQLIYRGWTSEDDVDIEIKFCGFSPFADVHLANYDWGSVPGLYAVVGHEITGVITKIGDNVKANLNQASILFYQTIFIVSNQLIRMIVKTRTYDFIFVAQWTDRHFC